MPVIYTEPAVLTESGQTIGLDGCYKYALLNIASVASGKYAHVYLNEKLAWVIAPQESVPMDGRPGDQYRQQIKVDFKDETGNTRHETGSLSVLRNFATNEVQPDVTLYPINGQ